jgi:hypothetical protein
MKASLMVAGAVLLLVVGYAIGSVAGGFGVGRAEADPASLTDLEREFTERMQNVALEGFFTIEGRERRDGNPELYEIESVTKLEGDGDLWRFNARIAYGSVDATLPVVVPVVWAGDTPMVSITDFEIPGLGDEFGARVVFYDERYAGTWDHGQYGGLMYGVIRSMD